MKIITPCCKNIQDWNPRNKPNWNNRKYSPRTDCKTCKKSFEVKAVQIINEEIPEIVEKGMSLPSTNRQKGITYNSLPLLNIDYDNIPIKKLLKNWSIYQIANNTKFSQKAVETLAKEEFLEQGEMIHGVYWTSDTKPFKMPNCLYPWQITAYMMLAQGSNFMWQASRQKAGKTVLVGISDLDFLLKRPRNDIAIIAPTQELGKKLIHKIFNDEWDITCGPNIGERFYMRDLWEPYLLVDNVLEKVLKNGSRLFYVPANYAAVQGISAPRIHVEEFDKLCSEPEKRHALAALFPIIRNKPNTQIVMTCNNASGVYRVMRDTIKKFGKEFLIYLEKPHEGMFTGEHIIYNDFELPGEKRENIKELILKELVETLMTESYAAMQLSNIDDYGEDPFNPEMISKAYENFDTWLPPKYEDGTSGGIDPGFGHLFAVMFCSVKWDDEGLPYVWEVWSKHYQGANDNINNIIIEVQDQCKKLGTHTLGIESNSGGLWFMKAWRQAGINCVRSNFGGDPVLGADMQKYTANRSTYMQILRWLLDNERIFLHNPLLRKQLGFYNPDINPEKNKGDYVDALMHCLWVLLGGLRFVSKIQNYNNPEIKDRWKKVKFNI